MLLFIVNRQVSIYSLLWNELGIERKSANIQKIFIKEKIEK